MALPVPEPERAEAPRLTLRGALRFLPVLALLLVAGWILVGRIAWSLKSDEERIRHAVHAMAEAAGRRHANDLLDFISPTRYHDRFHQDRSELGQTLRRVFFRYRSINVRVSEMEVELEAGPDPRHAMVRFHAESRFSLAPDRPGEDLARHFRGTDRFVLEFRKEDDGAWRVSACNPPERF